MKMIRIVSIVILFRKRLFWDGKMLEDSLDASWQGGVLKEREEKNGDKNIERQTNTDKTLQPNPFRER